MDKDNQLNDLKGDNFMIAVPDECTYSNALTWKYEPAHLKNIGPFRGPFFDLIITQLYEFL